MRRPLLTIMRFSLLWAVALSVGCGGGNVATGPSSELQRALALRDDGRLPEAEDALAPLAEGGDLLAILALADTLMLRGRHSEAVTLLRPVAEKHPTDPEVAGALARAFDGAGRDDDALSMYAKRMRLVPSDAASAVRMSEILLGRREFVMAGEVVSNTLRFHPDHAQLHVQMARSLLGRGRVPQALESAHRATQLAPQSPDAWLELAQVLTVAGENDLAEVAFGKCLAIDPQHPEALRDLGLLLVEKGESKKALEVLRRAIQVTPDSVQAWNALAAARHRERDYEGATAALEQAERLKPGVPQIHKNLAEVALDDGRPGRALAEAARLRDLLRANGVEGERIEEAETLMVRAIVVQALADGLCRKTRDGDAVQREVDRQLANYSLTATVERVTELGSSSLSLVQAAAARCNTPAKVGP
ncbi:MAG: tetratricopeptide repeat protein [Myxococcota bacterium]